jgi:hypothetical protein
MGRWMSWQRTSHGLRGPAGSENGERRRAACASEIQALHCRALARAHHRPTTGLLLRLQTSDRGHVRRRQVRLAGRLAAPGAPLRDCAGVGGVEDARARLAAADLAAVARQRACESGGRRVAAQAGVAGCNAQPRAILQRATARREQNMTQVSRQNLTRVSQTPATKRAMREQNMGHVSRRVVGVPPNLG